MILLLAAVLANLIIAICFKLFDRFNVDRFTAIVVNYWASLLIGSALSGQVPLFTYSVIADKWTLFAIILSVLFVGGFTITAFSVRYVGMAITTAMQKMSLLISAFYAVLFFHEPLGILKLIGLLLAIVAVILITRNTQGGITRSQLLHFFFLPLGTLIFSGLIESILYYVHAHQLAIEGDLAFVTYGFSAAACIGTIVIAYRSVRGTHRITKQDILGGLALGIPNFFTIYLILTLLSHGFPGSVLYPVLNILVLALTAVTGLFLFKEKLSKINIAGLLVALLAILLISLSK